MSRCAWQPCEEEGTETVKITARLTPDAEPTTHTLPVCPEHEAVVKYPTGVWSVS